MLHVHRVTRIPQLPEHVFVYIGAQCRDHLIVLGAFRFGHRRIDFCAQGLGCTEQGQGSVGLFFLPENEGHALQFMRDG